MIGASFATARKGATDMTASRTSALVLGKFMPLHRGHEELLRFAQGVADDVFVVVDNIVDPWVPAASRIGWAQAVLPQAQVFHLPAPNPQDPSEHPAFWDIWRETLLALLPRRPDYVVASEAYGAPLADVLGARFVPFDIARQAVPVSGTMLRRDLFGEWEMLSAPARRDYTFRVCVFGPESTGKSTLTQLLADYYQTVAVPEYARTLIEAKGGVTAEDMPAIARGQQALIDLRLPQARRVLFTDTDALATTVWSRWLFGAPDAAVEAVAAQHPSDFYLLTAPDLPWVPDMVRYFDGRGPEFFDDCRETLARHGRAFAVVGGQGPARLQNAVAAVDTAMARFFADIQAARDS